MACASRGIIRSFRRSRWSTRQRLATGAPPGSTTILGDEVSLTPRLSAHKVTVAPNDSWANQPVNLENSITLATLNGPKFFNGALLGSESIGQQVRRAGGYLAIIGKKGPAFTFDDSVTGDPAIGTPIAAGNFIFVSDDLVAPPALKSELAPAPPRPPSESAIYGARDTYFAQIVTERALPEAKAGGARRPSRAGRFLAAQSRRDAASSRPRHAGQPRRAENQRREPREHPRCDHESLGSPTAPT